MKNIINNIIHPTTRRTSKPLPMPENVRKGYLLGKYGATPNVEIEEVE